MKYISFLAYISNFLSYNDRPYMLTGSEYIANYIQKNYPDSNHIFTYTGGANLHLLDKLSKNKHFKLIFNRHEQFVGHSAEGYAKSSNKIGIAITTSGPGITNMITPLQDAYSDSIPMICISAQVSSKVLGTNAFQEVNAIELTKSCTKWNYLVDKKEKLGYALDLGFYHALHNKKGPVHIDICSDVLSEEIKEDYINKFILNIIKRKAKLGNKNNYFTLKFNLPDRSLNINLKSSLSKNIIPKQKFSACEMEINLQIKPFFNNISIKTLCVDKTISINVLYDKNFDEIITYTGYNKVNLYKKIDDVNFEINSKIKFKIIRDYMIYRSKRNSIKIQKSNCTELDLDINLEPVNKMKHILTDIPKEINIRGSIYKNTIGIKMEKNITDNPIISNKLKLPLQKYYQIQKIALLLNNAKSPVIIAGKGAISSYQFLRNLSNTFNIPVATTLHGLGIIDEDNILSLKMLGMHGTAYANKAIQQADVILGIGYRFDDRTIGNPLKYAPIAKKNNGIIHIDINMENINIVKKIINPNISLQMDSNNFINKLIPLLEYNNRSEWIDNIIKLKNDYKLTYNDTINLKIPDVIKELSNQKKDNIIITTGVGNHQMMTAQYYTWKYPQTMISSGSLGTMGVGLPFAIGSYLANPNKTIVLIDGDGSIMMSIQELATIKQYNIPVKILIMNDNSLQMVTSWQEIYYDNNIVGTKLRNPKFMELGRSFGIKSIVCDSKYNLGSIMRYILAYEGPIICEFLIKESNICTPFVKPGNALDDMLL